MELLQDILVCPSKDEGLLITRLLNLKEIEGFLCSFFDCFCIFLLRLCNKTDVLVHVLLLISLQSLLEELLLPFGEASVCTLAD